MAIEKYADMLALPHHQSTRHPHMSLRDRAAQFAPFAALTGYGEAVEETARLTGAMMNLDEDAVAELDRRLRMVEGTVSVKPVFSVTYFLPDDRKDGGAYVTVTGAARRVDRAGFALHMEDGTVIPVDDIISLDGALFEAQESV